MFTVQQMHNGPAGSPTNECMQLRKGRDGRHRDTSTGCKRRGDADGLHVGAVVTESSLPTTLKNYGMYVCMHVHAYLCVWMPVHATAHVWRSENNRRSQFSPSIMWVPGDWVQVTRLGSSRLYSLSCLVYPYRLKPSNVPFSWWCSQPCRRPLALSLNTRV